MFLVTTADQRFWKTDKPILFLGEWCKLFSQRGIWENLSYEILPYHWDDRRKLHQDYLYLNKLYEQTLCDLSKCLNQIHCVNHTLRYWRILIGPWLLFFVQILYDRYRSIVKAVESQKVTDTIIGGYEQGQWLPKDSSEFMRWFTDDAYNHYLYSRIIEHLDKIPFSVLKVKGNSGAYPKHRDYNSGFSFTFKKVLKYFIRFYEKFTCRYFNRIVFVIADFFPRDLLRLQFSLGQFPFLFPVKVTLPNSNIKWDLRNKIICKQPNNEFEQLLNKILREQIPMVYLEGYNRAEQISLNAYPAHPKIILTATAHYGVDAFKFWAAYHVDRGVKLAGVQHGGLYGSALWHSQEEHELKVCDRFYTWGWSSKTHNNTKSLPVARLNTLKQSVSPNKKGRILMVLSAMPRYSYHLYSGCVASSGYNVYLDEQFKFVENLSDRNKELLLVRLYQVDFACDQQKRWSYKFPDVECCTGCQSIDKRFNESRLVICTYNATTFLETFTLNIPTIIFWNPHQWELRPDAQPYYDELRRVGILHDTPESAAKKVNEICEDTISWWQQPEIQTAKNQFCHQFAYTSDDWMKRWSDELKILKV
ncbi:MAG: hypothetical protein JW983_09510 [Elusimicrobia bacterium]|nr:hypothetical protein [Elusimicrobiota bacterium]